MTPSPDLFVQYILDEIDLLNIKERVTLQSFDVRTLQVAHDIAPNLQLALLVGSHAEMIFHPTNQHKNQEVVPPSEHWTIVNGFGK